MIGTLLFAVYCNPIADVSVRHGIQYHEYEDDTQLHLAMRADNTPAGLSAFSPSVPLTLVPTERPTAQPGQVQSSRRRNDQSAACGDVISVTCVRGKSRSK